MDASVPGNTLDRTEVRIVSQPVRLAAALAVAATLGAAPASGAVLTLTIIDGLKLLTGETIIPEPIPQETLGSSTLTQLGTPALFDPSGDGPLSLTVRITNISTADVLFPEFLPGVSVLTYVTGVPGYTTTKDVADGGTAGSSGGAGNEGEVSRTALDLTLGLDVAPSPVSGSNGGGGGAGTGVADNLISATGASGAALAAYLAGATLAPGEWVDVPAFVTIAAFHRALADARIGIGLDLPTFRSGGVTVTTGAWTGSFLGPDPAEPSGPTADAPEPGTAGLFLAGLGAAALTRLSCRPCGQRG
jgi:PEP-CTERM motif